jgi:hypothetical protein
MLFIDLKAGFPLVPFKGFSDCKDYQRFLGSKEKTVFSYQMEKTEDDTCCS